MQIQKEILKLKNLPPLSAIAERILDAVSDEDIALERLAKVLEQSPELTARLLGVANSAYFSRSRAVVTLSEAITRVLGLTMVKSLALAFVLGNSFQLKACPAFQPQRYWLSAMLTALLAQHLNPHIRLEDKPSLAESYTAGLLSNLGLLALVHVFPQAMNQVFERHGTEPGQRLSDLSRADLETDHHEAGAWLAERWGLPPPLVAVIRHHHQPDYRQADWPLVVLVGISGRYAKELVEQEQPLQVDDVGLPILEVPKEAKDQVIDLCLAKREALAEMATILAKA